jgi:hypothetical protein
MIRQSIASAPVFGAASTAGDLGYCALPAQPREWLARTLLTNAYQLDEARSRAFHDRSTGLPGGSKPLNVLGLAGVVPVNRNEITFAQRAGSRARIELRGPARNPITTICYQRRFRPS